MDFEIITIILLIMNAAIFIFFKKINFLSLVLDKPDNSRKKHKIATPLAGGQIFFLSLLIIFIFGPKELFYEINLINSNSNLISLVVITSGIFLIGFKDDINEINPNFKLLLLFTIIMVLLIIDNTLQLKSVKISFYGEINSESYSLLLTTLCFLLFMNAFNMFDGMNCQSSIFIFFILIYLFSKSIFVTFLILITIPLIIIAILNYQGKSFLGDGGTYLISFILAYLFIRSYNNGLIDFSDDIFICMMIPGIDMFRLFIERILNKQNPFKADRRHLHHILLDKFGYNKSIVIITLLFFITFIPLILKINPIIIVSIYVMIYLIIIIKYKKIS